MNNEMTLQGEFKGVGAVSVIIARCAALASVVKENYDAVMDAISCYYAALLNEEVSVARTKALINAQLGFFALIMPMDLGYIYRIAAFLWFAIALLQCKATK